MLLNFPQDRLGESLLCVDRAPFRSPLSDFHLSNCVPPCAAPQDRLGDSLLRVARAARRFDAEGTKGVGYRLQLNNLSKAPRPCWAGGRRAGTDRLLTHAGPTVVLAGPTAGDKQGGLTVFFAKGATGKLAPEEVQRLLWAFEGEVSGGGEGGREGGGG